ncbi:valine--tRNA ligase [Microvirga tunisiensis]|jgi:valyl-tRNA synthetase|uniref:Valine--tRNA ligase n=1 Tax=Microvirga tunisiensis TaxID=2108360 RepID=A0A5N7MFL3_9HYPH|nr:valine--tRNA ligase [Microvirga tunisiensis]MPR08095.1 valine--tRNA ligase [Microvirga tunisiensis]MPR24954.1 valine--tRNA ligase [Microvirga tunisiensis]
MMDKTFDPSAVEARISTRWEEAEAFRAGRADRKDAVPYTIVIPPPNVTGSLHMGHALNNTIQDILCRFERMRGKDVLWQPGMDHAGIATQMVVERQLAERQIQRRDLGREEFVKRVWEWKEESGGTIVRQLKRLGASCDWSRERFTMDEGLSRAVLKVFVDLYKQGLIYKDKRLVNWDPKFQTAISDLEVQQVEVKGNLWHIRYAIDGMPDRSITVATTRPETMLGDVAVAVHPEDERYKDLVGKFAILPLVGRRIPIVADEYSDPEKGTGAVKITPAHDFNDFEVGKRHKLPLINIFGTEAQLALAGNEAFLDGLNQTDDLKAVLALDGLDRFEARKRIVAMLEEREILVQIEPHAHTVPHGDRSNVVIEPYLTDQWYVNVKPLADRALDVVRKGQTKFVPENWEKTYFQWLENIEPWCVSRQLWWGHQIPAWYDDQGNVYVAMSEDEAKAEARAKNGRDVPLKRDEDVLDTWFSSALWPFSTLGWPDDAPELKRYYPTNTLVTGFDIIFFWVARMMMMGLHFMDEVPFDTVYIHALVRDEKGAKMSKSKGNVIDPLDVVEQYGADALRMTLTSMAAQGRDIKLSVQRVENYRNFATKIWNAARFAEMNECRRVAGFDPKSVKETLNKWALSECAKAINEVASGIQSYKFNEAAGAAYRFVWNVFCDWTLELSKPVLQGADSPAKDETRATIAFILDEICKLLHPIMPFLTEELWEVKGQEGPKRETILALAPWSNLDDLIDPQAEAEIGWVVDLVTEIRSARSETNVPAGAQIPLVLVASSADVKARAERWGDIVRRLARISDISYADAAPKSSIQLLIRGEVAALPLEGVIDLDAERARLAKEIQKLDVDVGKIDAKLGNADFIKRAPEEVVEEQRERRDEALARKAKMEEALGRLRDAG